MFTTYKHYKHEIKTETIVKYNIQYYHNLKTKKTYGYKLLSI